MNKIIAFTLLFCLVLLAACTTQNENQNDESAKDSSKDIIDNTEETSGNTSETSSKPVEESVDNESSETPDVFEPYVVKISRADFPIYKGAGYEYGFACYVEKASGYTIVEEAEDDFGNLWGRLKSGAGWVDLTQLEIEEKRGPVLTMMTLTDDVLNSGKYLHCPASTEEYATQILLKANIEFERIEFYPAYVGDGGLVEEPTKYTQLNCPANTLLLVDVSFPGDLSEYGIRAFDKDGFVYRYSVYCNLSGEGDSYLMHTYAP